MEKDTEKKIQELQVLEQNLQNILMQKQAFQFELNEVENALIELEKSSEEVYKIAGQIMIKCSKDELKKELDEKKHLLDLRLKSIDKQEVQISETAEKLREEIVSKISETKKDN